MIRRSHLLATAAATSLMMITAHADDSDIVTVESSSACYNGDSVVLDGGVVIRNTLGKMLTDHAAISNGDGATLTLLELDDGVTIFLDDGASLRCHNAVIDFPKLLGTFSGAAADERVIFTDSADVAPVVIKSMTMEVALSKESTPPRYSVDDISAEDDVYFSYGDAITAFSDKALYRYFSAERYPDDFGSVIVLTPHEKGRSCRIVDNRGIAIDAKKVRIETNTREVSCSHAAGAIDGDSDTITFSAGTVSWNIDGGSLALHDDVIVDQKTFGHLTAVEDLYLNKGADGIWSSATGNGTTTWSYTDDITGEMSMITCHGTTLIDNAKNIMLFSSDDSSHATKRQVYHKNGMGEMFADTVAVHYIADESGDTAPKTMVVTGDVKIINDVVIDGKRMLKYAIADRADYSLGSEAIVLKADEGKRVLFFDKNNNLQVSAEAVTIHLLENDNEETISTVGDVRFALNEEEYDMIKQQFNILR